MKTYSRVILMGDPSQFRIKQGVNPHTRNWWGLKKRVDRVKASEQWTAMQETLSRYGVQIHVIPAHPDYPGLVFPANAGYTIEADSPCPLSGRRFILSHLNPARAGEGRIYRKFIRDLGPAIESIQVPFEGEADLIRWGDEFLFTYGDLKLPRFLPRLGFPPWRRQYGFRSSRKALQDLAPLIPCDRVLAIRLIDERYYHGDTVFCAFGPKRRYLLAFLGGIAPDSRRRFQENRNVICLSEVDATNFAANSFACQYQGQEFLFMPAGVSAALKHQIEALGVHVILIDVSEFLRKGGGAVKCMIHDFGVWAPDQNAIPSPAR